MSFIRSAPLYQTLELLIETVKSHPCIYDPGHTDYKVKQLKEEAWAAVGATVNMTGERAKRHWKSLRDVYTKERLKPNSKWKYLTSMSFLSHFVTSRKSRDGFQEEEFDGETLDHSEVEYKFRVTEDDENGESADRIEAENKFGFTRDYSTGNGPTEMEFSRNNSMNDHHNNSTSNHVSNDGYSSSNYGTGSLDHRIQAASVAGSIPNALKNLRDEDLYGLSVAWTLKRLTPRKRAFAKMKIQQLLFEVEFGEDQNDQFDRSDQND